MNTTTNIFEQATRMKLRFPTVGTIGVEDLWDLRLNLLDKLHQDLMKQIRATQEDSLLTPEQNTDPALLLSVEIVRYIVGVRLAEKEGRTEAAAKKAKIYELEALIAEKQAKEMLDKPLEELLAMRAALDE